MSELQATVEFSVELHKFYNVDLFQRGFYQIRCELRSAPKLSAKVEVSLPHQVKSLETTLPACIINGVAVSKTFQILYRNEEIVLDDVIHYRVHIILDSAKIQETINSADFEVDVGLWFSEDGFGMDQLESLELVSSRLLKLDFLSSRGVHYSFPVLFDYFHLSAVSLTVHGALVSVHQPYLRSPRQGNKKKGRNSANLSLSTMETVLFGQSQLNVKYGTLRTRLAIASTIYQEVCLLLLQALEGLQSSLEHLCRTLPITAAKPSVRMVDVRGRLLALSRSTELLDNEDDFLQRANSDISQLCAENILLWNKYLEVFTLVEEVRRHLAEIHHNHRLRRFSEGFFTMRNPRKSMLCCLDAKHQHHLHVSEAVRKSEYFGSLPNLQIHCKDLDGTPATLPIIFEDTYSDGLPKRQSSCDNIRLYPGCLLVPSGDGCERPQNTTGNNISPEILLIDQNHTPTKEAQENDKNRRKKISLPGKLSRTRTTREIGSQEFKEKYMIPRKSSLDSGLRSPGAENNRFNIRSRLRNSKQDKRRNSKEMKAEQPATSLKGTSGFSHLECCAEVPYNLQEEPDDQDMEPRLPPSLTDPVSTPGLKRPDHICFHSKMVADNNTSSQSSEKHTSDQRMVKSEGNNSALMKKDGELDSSCNDTVDDSVVCMDEIDGLCNIKSDSIPAEEEESSFSEQSGYVSNPSQPVSSSALSSQPSLDLDASSPDSGELNRQNHPNLKSNDDNAIQPTVDQSNQKQSITSSFFSPNHIKGLPASPVSLSSVFIATDSPIRKGFNPARPELCRNSSIDAPETEIEDEEGKEGGASEEINLQEISSSSNSESIGTSRLLKFLKKEDDDSSSGLDSPGLVLKGSRSRSEEPPLDKMKRPRRRSENNANQKAEQSLKQPIGKALPSGRQKSVPPPHQFRDPPNKQVVKADLKSCEAQPGDCTEKTKVHPTTYQIDQNAVQNFEHMDTVMDHKAVPRDQKTVLRDQRTVLKGPRNRTSSTNHPLPPNSIINAEANTKHQERVNYQTALNSRPQTSSHKINSHDQLDHVNSYGRVNSQTDQVNSHGPDPIVISFERPDQRMGSCASNRKVESEEKCVDLNRMSRSNTIAFISPSEADKEGFRMRLGTEKPNTDTSRRKQQTSETLLTQRLSSSLQFIDRNNVDSVYIHRREEEGEVLEHTPVVNQPVVALESSNLGFTCCDWLPNHISLQNPKLLKKIETIIGPAPLKFVKARENFKRTTGFPGALYSDLQFRYSTPYFTQSPETCHTSCHLVICVHGLDGNAADLRLVKTYLEMALPSANLDFLMSEINQSDTFTSLEDMTDKLVNEITCHMKNVPRAIKRISFIGHSLGCILIRSAITSPELSKHAAKFYTFLSLSGPHLGTLYNASGLVNAGLWMIQKWKKAGSLQQLTMKDCSDIRGTFLYKLSQKSNLQLFKHVLLAGSSQDKYVPIHSARIELCKSAIKDSSVNGSAYKEMVHNILSPIVQAETELVRYDIQHALPNNTNSLIGRAAHIAVLDSELFIEKFLVIAALKYFQ